MAFSYGCILFDYIFIKHKCIVSFPVESIKIILPLLYLTKIYFFIIGELEKFLLALHLKLTVFYKIRDNCKIWETCLVYLMHVRCTI